MLLIQGKYPILHCFETLIFQEISTFDEEEKFVLAKLTPRIIFSLPLTSFPMIEPGFQSLLREPFPLQPRHFHCSPGAFPPQPRHFHRSPGAFPLQPRNQASKTKCQHSSSLISSIKKRTFVLFERASLPEPGIEPGSSHIVNQHSS